MSTRSALITVMTRAADRAGRSLVHDLGEVEALQVSRKGPADFVSQADHNAERIIRRELEKARPGYGFVMEEAGEVKGTDEKNRRWIIDPLDGTTNFLHGIPHFAISIALEEAGEIVAGVIHNPATDELFWAEKGRGAWFNDRRMRVSGRKRLGEALVATGMPFLGRGDTARFLRELEAVMPKVAGIRRFGAAALDLAYVAAGRYDAFWEVGLNAWDVAAGTLMVREAGGFVSEIDLRANPVYGGTVLAGNPTIHGEVAKLLRQARQQPRSATA